MAAPVGHIVCALMFLNTHPAVIDDEEAFLMGTSFPDIRYIGDIERSATHAFDGSSIDDVLKAPSSFELGRRFHVFVDRQREKHMREHGAYRFLQNGPLRTQMLKIVEDHILFIRLKGFLPHRIFARIYPEEIEFVGDEERIRTWHALLSSYLDNSHWFNATRYLRSLLLFQDALKKPSDLFERIWIRLKTLGFFIYAYFQVEKLSREQGLRSIILDFYDRRMEELLRVDDKPNIAMCYGESKTSSSV